MGDHVFPPSEVESDLDLKRREADDARKRMNDEERKKREEKERKKAEVRKRLEEAAKSKKAKKGFMTPERKKKLRVLLRKMAAEQLKAEQEKKAQERRKIIKERCGDPKAIDGANEAAVIKVIQDYHKRITKLEDNKYDLEYVVRQKDFEINELNIQVNDLRGKFVKPVLKKVNKYDPKKFKIIKPTEINFHQTLKKVDSNKFSIEDSLEEKKKTEKPEWALGAKKQGEEGEVEE